MNVTHGREQVMLNLEVQPPRIPAGERMRRGKIRGRFHLMHRPFLCHPPGVGRGGGKCGVLDNMRELKHQREGETEEPMHDHERNEHMQHGMEAGRQNQHIAKIQALGHNKYAGFPRRLFRQCVLPNMA